MTLDAALRASEVLLALAFLQSSAEHMFGPLRQKALMAPRCVGAGLLLVGVVPHLALLALVLHALVMLHRFDGPYNGGSDRMGLLVLFGLTLAAWVPAAAPFALGYVAVQLVLSYFISGKVKLQNPDWRSGTALRDVFAFSAYPVAENLRALARHPQLLRAASWAVIALEVFFPLALIHQGTLFAALIVTMLFHIANACLFGLNRFVWAWAAAYPSLIWLQGAAFG
ncbi:MAG: HTTM domain-containing protein [Pseudomonadota bacterium]